MKCKLTCQLKAPNPHYNANSAAKHRQRGQRYPIERLIMLPIGHEVDVADCWKMVRAGVAMPSDDECAAAAGMTEEQIAAAQEAQAKVAAGIHPDDYAAYDAGIMVGYNPDGSFKPGPNHDQSKLDAFVDSMEGNQAA